MTGRTTAWAWRGPITAAWLALAGGLAAQALVPDSSRTRRADAACTLDLPQRDAGSVVVLGHDGSEGTS